MLDLPSYPLLLYRLYEHTKNHSFFFFFLFFFLSFQKELKMLLLSSFYLSLDVT